MDSHALRQSLAGKLVDAVFIVCVAVLLYAGKINEWAGVLLLGGIAQARGAVGLGGKLAGVLGSGGSGGPPSEPPPAGPGGTSSGGGGSSGTRRGGGGALWREQLAGWAWSSAVAFAAAPIVALVLGVLERVRHFGLLAIVALGVACVG